MPLYRLMMPVMCRHKVIGVLQIQRDEARISPGRWTIRWLRKAEQILLCFHFCVVPKTTTATAYRKSTSQAREP